MNTISVTGFSKQFGEKRVIDDLSFEVEQGALFAFLGANGSGKTTTIRTLLGIYDATEGELLINGKRYSSDSAENLGYLPEERGIYLTSKVLETMVYFGQLKGLSKSDAQVRAEKFLERVDLASHANTEIKKLSSGQQQKIQLGITIINEPALLILDEPTKGFDPLNRELLMNILRELNQKGTTIVFTTHQMEEMEHIASHVMMIKNGKRALYGDTQSVKEDFRDTSIQLRCAGEIPESKKYLVHNNGDDRTVIPADGVEVEEAMQELLKTGVKITDLQFAAPSLREIFIQVMNDHE